MDENTIHLKAHIDTSEMDEVTCKAERLASLLKEASSLVDELASKRMIMMSAEVSPNEMAKVCAKAVTEEMNQFARRSGRSLLIR